MGGLAQLLNSLSADPGRRGREFELVAKWFLTNDPRYSLELERIWLWNEWPGRWAADAGIDIVARDRRGGLWAIQAKAYSERYAVTKTDLDKFLSESSRPEFIYRLLIATTNRVGSTAQRTLKGQEKPVGQLLLGDLQASPVSWPRSAQSLKPSKPPRKRPRAHQRVAIKDVVRGLFVADRGRLIMACGTGKTLVSLGVAEAIRAQRVLVLVPSLSLLSQTLIEWTTSAQDPFRFLAVCSDEGVVDEDAVVAHVSDLGIPVTTAPGDIARFLRKRGPAAKLVFATYQSSPRIAEAMRESRVPAFDLAVADEAHRCAGPVSSDFATILDSSAIRAKKRLFMTATPRYFTGRLVNESRERDFEIASMDDDSTFGPSLHRLSFAQAIEQGLLTDYQVVIIGVDDHDHLKWMRDGRLLTLGGTVVTDARSLAAKIGLAKAMRNYDLKRVVTFHSRVSEARRFSKELPQVIDWMPTRERPRGSISCDYVAGTMNAGERNRKLQRLRQPDTDRGLLANARCLTEGIDIPALDAIAFIDPRRSEVDIVQAVGRAIRKSDEKKIGSIVIPVFIGTGDDAEAEIERSTFKPVWDVLNALRAHDEELATYLDAARVELGRSTAGSVELPSKIIVDLPSRVPASFAVTLRTRIVEHTTRDWLYKFGLVQRYAEEHGHSRIPQSHICEGVNIGTWVNTQRTHETTLPADRRRMLESLPGWTWEPHDFVWNLGYQALLHFVAREGHCRVPPMQVEDDIKLGRWVIKQRSRKEELGRERISKLEQLPGWTWEALTTRWDDTYSVLAQFARREGHAVVPLRHVERDVNLGLWVFNQRRRRSRLSTERQAKLESLPGWSWNKYESRWDSAMGAMRTFIEREGHARVPQNHIEGEVRLGSWLANLRTRRTQLSGEKIAELEALTGWTWNVQDRSWEHALIAMKAFAQREGHARVPTNHVEGDVKLGQWVASVRARRTRLPEEKIVQLETLPGWEWRVRGAKQRGEES